MFLAGVIPLEPLDPPAPDPRRFLGRAAHALVLDLVRHADPALAASLHQARGDKPFTVALLPAPSGVGALRLTAFEPHLAQTIVERVLPNLPREVRLGNVHLAPGAPITDRHAHRWAGITSAAELVNRWFQNDPAPTGLEPDRSNRITLEFATPTAHRQIHRNIVFPMPMQLWGGWLRAWNTYAHPAFEADLIAQVEQHVALSQYALKTGMVDFGEFRTAGWIGRATFSCFSRERALWRVLNLLADFAFYCGTGYKTTQGMGQTRKITSHQLTLRRGLENSA